MLEENKESYFAALRSKDARFDGLFFVGVTSTGIYCRPVCRARAPKPENCVFFTTAAEAEKSGFRPCLLCRPELAPGLAPVDATADLAHRAAALIEENCGDGEMCSTLAGRLGVTDRHLRRAFAEAYNVTPVQHLTTSRLLLAKSLLTDTDLSILDIAIISGFGSLRRFNYSFLKRYRLAPTALRKRPATAKKHSRGYITLYSGYRPPYLWEQITGFLSPRSIPGVETIRDGEYFRTVRLLSGDKKPVHGWIQVGNRPQKNALAITISYTLLPELPRVLSRVRRLFDLYCQPAAVYETLERMNEISPGFFAPGIRLPGCFDSFEMSVRAILGQQITVKAATTLSGRIARELGVPVDTGIDGLTHVFPSPESIADLGSSAESRLRQLGIIAARAKAITALARVFAGGAVDFESRGRGEEKVQELKKIHGVGEWTAHYIAMRALRWTDAFPATDLGVIKTLAPRTGKEILSLAESWRPWRAYATMCLWNSGH